ncbi:unnamed protein product [Citrullus colocynthis]|uniref:Uncharacterized protein n=1 Tax=Citrullus colocynthis TaxID=252529 RepID=A0ABP0Z9C1_9ROSI
MPIAISLPSAFDNRQRPLQSLLLFCSLTVNFLQSVDIPHDVSLIQSVDFQWQWVITPKIFISDISHFAPQA